MNKFLTILGVLLLVGSPQRIGWGEMKSAPALAEDTPPAPRLSPGIPLGLEFSRFAALGKKSPFTLASSTEEAADFAKDLVLAGFVRLEGEDFIMVANKTKPERVLVGKKPSSAALGMVLVEVKKDPSGNPAKMEAKIRKGAETATLKYEVTGGGGASPPSPGSVGGQPVAPVPSVPILPGLPGQAQPGQVTGAPGQKNSPAVIRRRVIPIPSKAGK